DRRRHDSIIRRSKTPAKIGEGREQSDLHCDITTDYVKQTCGGEETDIGPNQSQHAAAEGGTEVRFEDDGNGHRDPIGTRKFQPLPKRYADRKTTTQPPCVAERRRT